MEIGNAQDWGPIKLMYKQPGGTEHQSIVDVFDEIIHRLDAIEKRLSKLEES